MLFSSTIWPAKVVIIADTTKFACKRAVNRIEVKSSRSGSESFGFRSLSSHTTVRAVRHTAVWLAFKVAIHDHLPSLLISAAD